MSQRASSETLGVEHSRMVVLIDDLERRSLVTRIASTMDRRMLAIYLTRDGLRQAEPTRHRYDRHIVKRLRGDDKHALLRMLRTLATPHLARPSIWNCAGEPGCGAGPVVAGSPGLDASREGEAVMDRSEPIEFWFTMGSTYTYLTVMRLPELAKETGISFRWRPFHLLTILQEMRHVPFADKPAKASYMWRDIERRARMYGVPARVPAPYPAKDSIAANHVAILGFTEGWGQDFVRAAYRRWFQLGQETGSEPNVSESLREIGQNPEHVLPRAKSGDIARRLEAETKAARDLGIFGSPTFSIEREVFWGDDRLDDAISWYRHGSVRQRERRAP